MTVKFFLIAIGAFAILPGADAANAPSNPYPDGVKEAKPLFASDDVIKIRIEGPVKELTRKASRSTDPLPAKIILEGEAGEEHAIQLSARGKSRRRKDVCSFPPLRVAFDEKPGGASLFDGQKRLKLVTHCKSSKSYLKYYRLEYSAYKLLNVLTPVSLRVRMAEIDYVEAASGKTIASRPGFFIEDTDDAAKRNGMKEIDVPDILFSQLQQEAAARYALFQYMIGNLDWSIHNSVSGSDCCHNTKLIGQTADTAAGLIPVPYDFDHSGLVNASYAAPPEGIPVRSVRDRRYRGLCSQTAMVRAQTEEFIAKRDALYAVIAAVPDLDDRSRRYAADFLDAFFDDISTPKKIDKRLFAYCRN